MPVNFGGNLACILQVTEKIQTRTIKGFSKEDELVFRMLATTTGLLLQNFHHKNKVQQHREAIGQVMEITGKLAMARSHQNIIEVVQEILPSFFGFEKSAIIFVDP
jgi:hypothetical protein